MRRRLLLAFAIVALFSSPVDAALIDGSHNPPEVDTFLVFPSFDFYFLHYDLSFDTTQPIDIAFRAVNSDVIPNFQFIGSITNQSGVLWRGMRLELWHETPAGAALVQSDGLDFDVPLNGSSPPKYSSTFPQTHTFGVLEWPDTPRDHDQTAEAIYFLDLANIDGNGQFVSDPQLTTGSYDFFVRHIPLLAQTPRGNLPPPGQNNAAPEPASGMLALAALLGLSVTTQRRSQRGSI